MSFDEKNNIKMGHIEIHWIKNSSSYMYENDIISHARVHRSLILFSSGTCATCTSEMVDRINLSACQKTIWRGCTSFS